MGQEEGSGIRGAAPFPVSRRREKKSNGTDRRGASCGCPAHARNQAREPRRRRRARAGARDTRGKGSRRTGSPAARRTERNGTKRDGGTKMQDGDGHGFRVANSMSQQFPLAPLAGEAGWGPASAFSAAAAPGKDPSRREARPQPLPPSGRGEKGAASREHESCIERPGTMPERAAEHEPCAWRP